MAKQILTAMPALSTLAITTIPGQFTAELRTNLSVVHMAERRGRGEALRAAVQGAYRVVLPAKPRLVKGAGIEFVWVGPGQWIVLADDLESRDLEKELRSHFGALASTADQSDGRAVVQIAGPRARDVLAKGVPIDLHPRAFQPGDAAITHAAHIGVLMWQRDERPTYDMVMFRTFAEGFANWLKHSAAEFNNGPGGNPR